MNIIIFSGAGLSAESGLSTFRDEDGVKAYGRTLRRQDLQNPEPLR